MQINPNAPKTKDRGPTSTEDTQTDFGKLDIFSTANIEAPATSVDACTTDGFHLNNGIKTDGGAGILLVGGEAFVWRPWLYTPSESGAGAGTGSPTGASQTASPTSPATSSAFAAATNALLTPRQTFMIPPASLAVLDLLYPKPDLLILGTGEHLHMLEPATRNHLAASLGIKVDVMDTHNACATYNLLATERGVDSVAGLFLPVGWTGNMLPRQIAGGDRRVRRR